MEVEVDVVAFTGRLAGPMCAKVTPGTRLTRCHAGLIANGSVNDSVSGARGDNVAILKSGPRRAEPFEENGELWVVRWVRGG